MAAEFIVDGMRYLLPQIQGKTYQIKVVCNERGAIFFPVTIQHADRCADGIVYKEGSKGNALAGMVYSDHVRDRPSALVTACRREQGRVARNRYATSGPQMSNDLWEMTHDTSVVS